MRLEEPKFKSEDRLASREQERDYLKSFVEDALDGSIQRRIDSARYVPRVAIDGDIRTSWQDYHGELEVLLDGTRQDLMDEIESLQIQLAALQTTSDEDRAEAAADVLLSQQVIEKLSKVVGIIPDGNWVQRTVQLGASSNINPDLTQVIYTDSEVRFSSKGAVACVLDIPPVGTAFSKDCWVPQDFLGISTSEEVSVHVNRTDERNIQVTSNQTKLPPVEIADGPSFFRRQHISDARTGVWTVWRTDNEVRSN